MKFRDPAFLKTFSYLTPPRVFGDMDEEAALRGWDALVARTEKKGLGVVAMSVNGGDLVGPVPVDSFLKKFWPNFAARPAETAKNMLAMGRTWFSLSPEASQLAHEISNQDPSMTTTEKFSKKQLAAQAKARVYIDYGGRTTIAYNFDEKNSIIEHTPMNDCGFELVRENQAEFLKRFKWLDDYPIERAAGLYLGYSQTLGGSNEAMAMLATLTNVTQQEIQVANEKKLVAPKKEAKEKKPAAKKASAKKSSTPKPQKEPKAPKEKKEPKPRGESASTMFKELIMEGKLTDDQIFEKVKAKFDLDDNKRGYVKWYRNDLKKKGQNPPEAKAAK